ncbi:hypothetical protein PSPO01_14184 [Paraphaeosphaeria sporulosa]
MHAPTPTIVGTAARLRPSSLHAAAIAGPISCPSHPGPNHWPMPLSHPQHELTAATASPLDVHPLAFAPMNCGQDARFLLLLPCLDGRTITQQLALFNRDGGENRWVLRRGTPHDTAPPPSRALATLPQSTQPAWALPTIARSESKPTHASDSEPYAPSVQLADRC